jgi:hypothetical protein
VTVLEITVIPESISVLGRHRKNPGKLTGLSENIATHGLKDPLILTTDHRILGGERCLLAILARGNGLKPVPAYVVDDLPETAELLLKRGTAYLKPMRAEEKVLLGNQLEILNEPALIQRRRLVGSFGGLAKQGTEPRDVPAWPGAVDYIGQVHNMARSTYQRLRFVWLCAQDPNAPDEVRKFAQNILDHIGDTGSVYSAYQQVRQSRLDAGLTLRLERRNIAPDTPNLEELPSRVVADAAVEAETHRIRIETGRAEPEHPEPKTRRKSLPDTVEKHAVALVAALAGLEKAQADDRWPLYRKKLAPSTRNELLNALPRIAGIVANLHPEDSREEFTA